MRLLLFLKTIMRGIESYFLGDLTVDKETLEEHLLKIIKIISWKSKL